jgi:hypothetical protein
VQAEVVGKNYKPKTPITPKKMFVKVNNPEDEESLVGLRKLCSKFAGLEEIILVVGEGETKKAIKMPFKIEVSEEFSGEVGKIFGSECVAVK